MVDTARLTSGLLAAQTLFISYPRLTEEDVKACFAYARALVEQQEHARQPTGSGPSPNV